MREMKDSRIEWAGKIPNEWNINKGKYFMNLLGRPTLDTDEVITCFRDGEVTLRSKRREEGFTISLTESGYQGIEVGDLIVHGMDGFAGAIGISDSRGKATPVLNVLDTNENKRFLMYLMRTMAYCELFLSLSTGIRVRTCDTNWKKLREIDYILPSKEEQKAIANYLDNKCAELNTLASDLQSQIEALEEYKRSVITEAVTKGLDPDVEMKESGVQWIGKTPKHWSVYRIAALYAERNERGNDELPLLSVSINTGVSDSELTDEESARVFVRSEDRSKYKRVYPQDLTYNMMRAWQGAFGAVRVNGMVSPAYVVAKPLREIDTRYIEALFRTPSAIQEMHRYSYGVADFRLRLYWDKFRTIKVCFPPLEEQHRIADYIDEKASEIDAIITEKKQQIEMIEEYKKSLIFEYVTGKKKVQA